MSGIAADYAFWQRVCALYLPLMAALLAAVATPRRPRRFTAGLLSFLWTIPALLLLERLNRHAAWWTYPEPGPRFCGMPLELYAGWVVLWGIVPTLTFPRLRLAWVAAWMAAFDLAAMPLCNRIVHLGPDWLVGEAAGIALVLAPALCLARWTERDTHLPLRAAMQVATSGLLFLFFVPEVSFAIRPGAGWEPIFAMPAWQRQLALLFLLALATPGVGAVMEFAQSGHGTPIPFDPPKRLVTTGIYRYLANPMQLSCTLTMLLWAAILRNAWLLIPVGVTIAYSAGIARWDERQDLAARFGEPWRAYRVEVRDWLPRLRPYRAAKAARLYMAATCGPCTQLRHWIEARSPVGMAILPAESLPEPPQRITYAPEDGGPAVSGVRALGRALEHLHLGWALAGTALRIPGIWQLVQLLMDVSGFGPQRIVCRNAPPKHATGRM